jgi:feruloyl esterase
MFKYLIFQDPDWDYSTYDFSNFMADTRYAASYLNATSTDYSVFKNKGGKLLIYHGWNDPALSALTSIEHVEAAKKVDPDLNNFLRLFLLPGVVHCGGGSGPSQTDWLSHIRNWVEHGKAPERIVLRKESDGKVLMTRPVFPYPKKTVYDGKGDPNVESSFH